MPLSLKGLELLKGFVGFLRRGDHALDLLDDGQLLLQVHLLFGFLFLEEFGTLFLDDAHFGLKHFLVFIGGNLISIRIATTVDIGLQIGFTLCDVQLVEGGLQIVDLLLLRGFVTMGDLLDAVEHLLLGLVDLTGLLWGFYFRNIGVLDCFFFYLLFEDVVLRVHHLTF